MYACVCVFVCVSSVGIAFITIGVLCIPDLKIDLTVSVRWVLHASHYATVELTVDSLRVFVYVCACICVCAYPSLCVFVCV